MTSQTPVEAPTDTWWLRMPQCHATANVMVARARKEGRVLAPHIYAMAGLPVDPEPAPPAPPCEPPPASPPAPPPACVPASGDLAIASEPASPDARGAANPFAAIASGAKFTVEHRVRFLDHLAFSGNARAAARRVGVSHETAYRARRQDPAFAALWDTALVLARHFAESELATRALDGVEVEVWHRGELVGHQVRHDTRLLLAHLGRLDRRVEADAAAGARAARFDALLAAYAGHPAPDGFAEAAGESEPPELAVPPTRAQYRDWYRAEVIDGIAEAERDDDSADPADQAEPLPDDELERRAALEVQAAAEAAAEADEEYDAWHDGAIATVAAIVEASDGPPVEVKSAPPQRRARGPKFFLQNCVTPVNTPRRAPRRASSVACGVTFPVNGGGYPPSPSSPACGGGAPDKIGGGGGPPLR